MNEIYFKGGDKCMLTYKQTNERTKSDWLFMLDSSPYLYHTYIITRIMGGGGRQNDCYNLINKYSQTHLTTK